jgi:peptide/nickel transport system substrate-binding protein
MRRFAVGCTAALIASLALNGCSNATPSPRAGAMQADPDHPVLVVARVKDAVVLDPAQSTDGMSLNVTTEIMKGLVQFKPGTFEIEPAIASSWEMGGDGRRWTFHLQKHLRFSDGTPLDAEAVKFNFDRWRLISDPYHGDVPYTYYATMFGGFPGLITGVRAPDAGTVVFELSRAFSPFLHDLAMPSFSIGSPSAIRNDLNGFKQRPIGWGPYTLAEWVKGDRIVLRANPDYPVRPAYTTVVIRDFSDAQRSVDYMRRGEIDVLTDPDPDQAQQLAGMPHVTVYYEPANNNAYLAMNLDRKPFDKLAVRQAIAYALDVHGIVHSFFPVGANVAHSWTPEGMVGEDPDVTAYQVDDARARALLASAGYRRGFTTELYYASIPRPYMPDSKGVAEAIRSQLRKIGITVKLRPLEWSVFLSKVHNGEHPMCLAGWSGDNGDPDNFMYTLLDQDSARRPNAFNYSFWRDERYHQLMLQGQATSDPASRDLIYQHALEMVHDMVPSIPIVHVTVPVALKTSIAGFIPSPDTHIAFEYLHPGG